ncbi:MAG TPA: response regulator [Sulfurospirillum sp. UBA12182]|nr:MAG TPA: response regulator [Sulfurospirillum sp. UBA12182]
MRKILLVDDNDNNRLTLELLLEEIENVEVFEAHDGEEAISMCQKENYDLIFMDIMMPRVDGFEATKAIKESGHKAMIIALSALDDEASKHKMMSLGAEDYLTKPVNAELFQMRVKNYLMIIDKRKKKVFDLEAINPFNKNVFNRSCNFRINSEEALAEFWDYWLNGTKNILDLSDCVRIIYGFGLWLLKRDKRFHIIAEENDEKLYITLFDISLIKKNVIRNLLLKHYPNAQYILNEGTLSFQLDKMVMQEKESIEISDEKKEILKKTHNNTIHASDYVNNTAINLMGKIDGLEEINNEIDEAILIFEDNPSTKTLYSVIENFEEYNKVLQQLDDFEHLAFAINTLMTFLSNITQEQFSPEKVKNLASMLLNLLHDLESWRQNVFILQNARDIHYLDASLLSSCIQMEAVFDDKALADEDEGELEFF